MSNGEKLFVGKNKEIFEDFFTSAHKEEDVLAMQYRMNIPECMKIVEDSADLLINDFCSLYLENVEIADKEESVYEIEDETIRDLYKIYEVDEEIIEEALQWRKPGLLTKYKIKENITISNEIVVSLPESLSDRAEEIAQHYRENKYNTSVAIQTVNNKTILKIQNVMNFDNVTEMEENLSWFKPQ